MNTTETLDQLKNKARELVKSGGELRARTAVLVHEAGATCHQTADGLRAVVKAVAEGAIAGARETLPADTPNVLKSVVDGVSDGLARSAQALRLTLEESSANGRHFASEDLGKVTQDFRDLGSMTAEVVNGAAAALDTHLREQVHTLSEHAKQTLQNAWPPLQSAIQAAQNEPLKLGQEAAAAGAGALRQAAGALFEEVGRVMQKAGEKLRA